MLETQDPPLNVKRQSLCAELECSEDDSRVPIGCDVRAKSSILELMGSEHRFRSATAKDADFLFDMLVAAVNWTRERHLSRPAVAADPALARYIDDWPRHGDLGVVAEADGVPIGAAWLRLFTADDPGYGYIADDVPELSMGVVEKWRGLGVGRGLLQEITRQARSFGHRAISLSVERANFAHRRYTDEGYQVVERGPESDTMVKEFPPNA